jgi:class 3 adenylate cyclase
MRSLWRLPWVWGLLLFLFLLIVCRGPGATPAVLIEIAVLASVFFMASTWGIFHPRRILPHGSVAVRDALLASFVLFLLTRGMVALASVNNDRFSAEIPSLGPYFPLLASGVLSLILFPVLLWFNLTLVALAGMTSKSDPAAERTILPLFWPVLFVSVVLDILILTSGKADTSGAVNRAEHLWPTMGASVFSPLTALFLTLELRRRGKDFSHVTQRLTVFLQRKCTRQRGWGPRDFRGLVLGGITGVLTLTLLSSPILHAFVAPYEGIAYSAATQLANQSSILGEMLETNPHIQIPTLAALLPKNTERLQALQKMVLISYDDSARHMALKTSEAHVQAQLLRHIAAGHPKAITLPYTSNDPDTPLGTLVKTALPHPEPGLSRERNDYPELAKAIKAARCVYLLPLSSLDNDAGEESAPGSALFKSAYQVASHQLDVSGSPDIPAINLKRSPPALALALTQRSRPHAASDELMLIDYRQELPQVRLPIAASQVLQEQSLYDPVSRTWKPAKEFFADKYVFIEPLSPRLRSTPLGLRNEMEVHAQATATLLQNAPFSNSSPLSTVLGTLFLAALVGQLCVGRAPLESLWKIALPLLMVVGLGIVLTAFTPLRVNPVLPILGGILSFMTVTQFTFAMERDERTRNRELLGRFVAPQAIDEILKDPEGKLGLGGTRRRIVVLFVDVRGFSGFAEKRTPEAVVTTMNRYLAIMTDVLNFHEGILDKYTGDGLMALFLVEEATQAIDVLRAVEAAQDMAREVQALAQTMKEEGGDSLAVGMGLHYGEAVVGMVGHPTRQINYTALGHTVVVAARLQTLAAGGEIILSEAVYRALPPGSIAGELGEAVTVKGVAEPVPIYRMCVPPK